MPWLPEQSGYRLYLTGLGLITSLGHSTWETFSALLAGRTIADRRLDLPAGVAAVDLVRATGVVAVGQTSGSDPAVELAERAAREALFEAGVAPTEWASLPVLLGSSKGAMYALTAAAARQAPSGKAPRSQTTSTLFGSFATRSLPADAELALALGPQGYLAHHLALRLHVPPPEVTIAACASSLQALHSARQRLLHCSPLRSGGGGRSGGGADHADPPDRALVLTVEAALLPLLIHSYRRLGVLPPLTTDADGYRGLPLDRQRCGFMLAEMAAAVVLERRPADQPPPPRALELLDTAVASESFDLIRPAPGMAALEHVARRLMTGRQIDLLHPHATGTPDHDAHEMQTYARLLAGGVGGGGARQPDTYAVKGALGHGLGAAGLVSLVIACLCARAGRRPAMPWLRHPLSREECGFDLEPNAKLTRSDLRTHAIFAAGFAGHVAGAVVQAA